MASLDYHYQTLFAYLANKIGGEVKPLYNRFVKNQYSQRFYLTESEYESTRKFSPPKYFLAMLIAPFQHFLNMAKDAIDTFKPYKSTVQMRRDFLQPIYGVGNILKGILNLILTPLILVINILRETVKFLKSLKNAHISKSFLVYIKNISLNFVRTLSWTLDGCFSLLRGMTQIVSTPLTWLIKIPLRSIITALKGTPKIEDSSSVKKLITKGKNLIKENTHFFAPVMDGITKSLHAKFEKGVSRGQPTNIDPEIEKEKFKLEVRRDWNNNYYTTIYAKPEKSLQDAQEYLDLFGSEKNALLI